MFIGSSLVIFGINRTLLTYQLYHNVLIERAEDHYLISNFCDQASHIRNLGRHTNMCLEAEKRLSTPPILHAFRQVIDDTLYREFHLNVLIQVGMVLLMIFFTSILHARFTKYSNTKLPLVKLKNA
jgi:hypothetical protein